MKVGELIEALKAPDLYAHLGNHDALFGMPVRLTDGNDDYHIYSVYVVDGVLWIDIGF